MNKIILLCAVVLISSPLNAMQELPIIRPETNEKISQIIQLISDSSDSTADRLEKIKNLLHDPSLGLSESVVIKNELVALLSCQIVRSLTTSTSRLLKKNCELKSMANYYLDGTQSAIDGVHSAESKPRSPWYRLSFQGFIKEYKNACQIHNFHPVFYEIPERAESPKA